MARLIIRDQVIQDVEAIAHYIASSNIGAGIRFYDAVADAFELLSAFPGAGPRFDPPLKSYPDLHFWPVTHYRNYLIIYRRLPDAVEMLRIVHGAQDLKRLLEEDPKDRLLLAIRLDGKTGSGLSPLGQPAGSHNQLVRTRREATPGVV